MYLAELAPSKLRGGLAGLNQLMVVGGVLIAYIIDWALSGSGEWRIMIAVAILPAVALFIGMCVMPETPRWLVKQGREDEARSVIRSAQGQAADTDSEINDIREVIRLDSERRGRFRDLGAAWVRPALVVALILAVGQQLSGVNAVNVYAPTMFTNLGFGNSASLLASVVLGTVKVILTLWVIFIVDRWGRRPLLLIGAGVMAATLLALGIAVETLHTGSAAGLTTLIMLILYLGGYELGWGAVVWIMISEVFPLKARGVGMGTASTALWAATFAITLVFPIMDDGIGLAASAWIFAAINLVLCLLVVRFVPETKGRSLEQIELDTRQRIQGGEAPAAALKEV
jgi:sugar porter (SP) family MFS transporter